MTAAVARRVVLLAVPTLPIAASVTAATPPAGFGRGPSVAEMFKRTRELDAAIDALDDDEFDEGQVPLLAERTRLVRRIIAMRSRDIRGCRLKLELLAEKLDVACTDPEADALVDSIEADLDALDRTRVG